MQKVIFGRSKMPAFSLKAEQPLRVTGKMIITQIMKKCNGQIDDVRVYNYALTATQVKGLYNNGAVNFAPASGAP